LNKNSFNVVGDGNTDLDLLLLFWFYHFAIFFYFL